MKEGKRKHRYITLVILAIIIIAGLTATIIIGAIEKTIEFREIEANAVSFCESAGLSDVTAKISGPTYFFGQKRYVLNIKGNGAEKIGYPGLKSIIESAEKNEITHKKSYLDLEFIIDGDNYRLSAYGGILYRGSDPVYFPEENSYSTGTYVSGNPYEGMSEDCINSTDLGPADELVKCKDFSALRADRRYKTYNWYNSSGRKKATATVYYKNGEGYVSSFSLIEYNAEAVKEAGRKLREEKKESKTDQCNTKDYSDPDDFYEDYYDDFYDYEDAEEYYYDNCD